jgi:hypothetical protein
MVWGYSAAKWLLSMIVYLSITNHGYGHAVRLATVAAKLKQIEPNIILILATTAPHWLLQSYIQSDFIYRYRAFDIGVIQSDSLNMDLVSTQEKLKAIEKKQESIITSEANFLKTNRVQLVIGDIPPLVSLIAQKAELPCWMMGNFGWDFIYQPWGEDFQDSVEWIKRCYGQVDHLLRLPFHEQMSSFKSITDFGLTRGEPRYAIEDLRETFNLVQPKERTILFTFGGLGVEAMPYQTLEKFPQWQFITFDRLAPQMENLRVILDPKYRPVDFMPLCARVISKPGYSSFAEALALEVPIATLGRVGFAETPLLIEGIQNYSQHQIINNQEFFKGNWQFLLDSPKAALSNQKLAIDGSHEIARVILEKLG